VLSISEDAMKQCLGQYSSLESFINIPYIRDRPIYDLLRSEINVIQDLVKGL
jgi:hypothetical protein